MERAPGLVVAFCLGIHATFEKQRYWKSLSSATPFQRRCATGKSGTLLAMGGIRSRTGGQEDVPSRGCQPDFGSVPRAQKRFITQHTRSRNTQRHIAYGYAVSTSQRYAR